FTPAVLSGVGAGMIGVLWAYEGWQYATFSAGEAKEPGRTLPPAIGLGTLALVLLYVLANVAYLGALSPDAVMASNAVAADAVGTVLGAGAAKLVAAAVTVSIFSAANGVTLTAPRAAFRMAQDGLFFRGLGEVHPRFLTPARAVLASGAWAALLAATGTFERLLTYVVFTGWIFYALAAASLLVLRRTRPEAPRPFRVPGYPWTPVLFVVAAAAIVLNTLLTQPLDAGIGLAIVFLGAPFYVLWSRRA
ncbi:MAG: amino acid permease, partial [Gemmatimonadetes bacterium]|nr:amino acid permease [Gemmatimonadota bacterium]